MRLQLRSRRVQVITLKLLRYPETFQATLSKNDRATKLGLKCVKCTDGSNCLRISKVQLGTGGAGDEHSKMCIAEGRFGEVLTTGMFIEKVNAEEGDTEKLFKEITTAKTVRLRLRRDVKVDSNDDNLEAGS